MSEEIKSSIVRARSRSNDEICWDLAEVASENRSKPARARQRSEVMDAPGLRFITGTEARQFTIEELK
jgi:hypothetical protein